MGKLETKATLSKKKQKNTRN